MTDDIVARLRLYANHSFLEGSWASAFAYDLNAAADQMESLQRQTERLRNELAARCGDGGAGAHTAGPTEHFIPEAL